ncbi:MAG: transposase [Bacteroidetes bacterium]|nr:transposase [Bacteroidota bacterium]
MKMIQVKTLFIEPGSLWENGSNESFNDKLRDELLNGEIFYTLKEAQILIEDCSNWGQSKIKVSLFANPRAFLSSSLLPFCRLTPLSLF